MRLTTLLGSVLLPAALFSQGKTVWHGGVGIDEYGNLADEKGDSVFLVSTTSKEATYRDLTSSRESLIQAYPKWKWLYDSPMTVEKFRRLGFNSLNYFALTCDALALFSDGGADG
mgnify:CR=1 FL=1